MRFTLPIIKFILKFNYPACTHSCTIIIIIIIIICLLLLLLLKQQLKFLSHFSYVMHNTLLMLLCFNSVQIMCYNGPVLLADFKLCSSAWLHRVLCTNTVPPNRGRFFVYLGLIFDVGSADVARPTARLP